MSADAGTSADMADTGMSADEAAAHTRGEAKGKSEGALIGSLATLGDALRLVAKFHGLLDLLAYA